MSRTQVPKASDVDLYNHVEDPHIPSRVVNKYCAMSSLSNESDVEQFLILPFLVDLGYTNEFVATKVSVSAEVVGKGRTKRSYVPDYIAYPTKDKKRPAIIIDVKNPNRPADEGVDDAQLYTSIIRRKFSKPKPEPYCVGCNGHLLVVKHYDSDTVLHAVNFADMIDGNVKFTALFECICQIATATAHVVVKPPVQFEFRAISPSQLPGIFEGCHRIIWKAEKRSPSSAFYEFAKLMYVKIDEDRKVRIERSKLAIGEFPDNMVPSNIIKFSSHWIAEMTPTTDSPINAILFRQLSERLEEQIAKKEKKRIFAQGEDIQLKPSTIKEAVEVLEHLDLYAVDEDLNGRLFETFLTATMRGDALGQFFTPRSVVKFMVKMARLKANPLQIDTVLDGCCGTGGFLIEAMANMTSTVESNTALSDRESAEILRRLRTEQLWGIDAGSDPPIARIARLNMLLHKDGGSRIYHADTLDKKLRVEAGLPLLSRLETDELRSKIVNDGMRFTVALSNPPFSMNYERKNVKECDVLQEYELFTDKTGRQRPSLRSSVMFMERYWDLLSTGGRLITIMDESILNTVTAKPFREYIMDHFIIHAVVALPKNTFVKAQGSVKTSVLYLVKKTEPSERQPSIFMALCGNVGHTDSGKDRPNLSQLPQILDQFLNFESSGTIQSSLPQNSFVISDVHQANPTLRIDAHFFNPAYYRTLSTLHNVASSRKGWEVESLGNLLRKSETALTGGATPLGAIYTDDGAKFIRVQNVHANYISHGPDDPCIPTITHESYLKRSQLKEGDVVLTITGSYGIAAVVPADFGPANINQHSVKIEIDDRVSPEYLSVFLNSALCKPQMDRAVTGSSRLALDYSSIRKLKILFPSDKATQKQLAASVYDRLSEAFKLRERAEYLESEMVDALTSFLGEQ